jgi:hypothetical protein
LNIGLPALNVRFCKAAGREGLRIASIDFNVEERNMAIGFAQEYHTRTPPKDKQGIAIAD